MKRTSVPLTALLAATFWVSICSAQQPPPPPPANAYGPGFAAQPAYSSRGTIKAFNVGPDGETNGLILNDGTAVLLPPETGEQLRASIKEGSRITFTGVSRPGALNRSVVDAQTITANGQTFTAAVAPPPPDAPTLPLPGGRGRGGRGPGPVAAGGPPPPPPGCSVPPPPPPPGPGR